MLSEARSGSVPFTCSSSIIEVQALEQLGREGTVELVNDFMEIGRYGIMRVPALVADEQVVLAGRVPDVSELMTILGGTEQ